MLRYVTYDSRYLEFLTNYDHRVRTAAKWVRMLRYSSHLSVRGYCDSSPNKVDVGFPAETTILFSRKFAFWGGHDKKRQGDERCNELRNHVTDALLRSLTLQLLTQYFFVEWNTWRRSSKETFLKTATLSVLVQAYPHGMKPNNENLKNAAVVPRWCYYGNIVVFIPLRKWNFLCVTSMRTYFAAVSRVSIMCCLRVVQLPSLY